MAQTGPGGSDGHTHQFELNNRMTSIAGVNPHVHVIPPEGNITESANNHVHILPGR